jgi:hypothetical protein
VCNRRISAGFIVEAASPAPPLDRKLDMPFHINVKVQRRAAEAVLYRSH